MDEDDVPVEALALEYTKHAVQVMAERRIPEAWVARAIAEPESRVPDPDDPEFGALLSPHPGTWWPRITRSREYQKHAVARGERVPGPERQERTMKLHVDREADALYLRLDDSDIVESEEVSPGVVLDYNDSNEVVGVEMLHLSKRSVDLNLSALHFETT